MGQMGLNLQLRRVKKMEFPEQESSKFQNRLENLVRRESQSTLNFGDDMARRKYSTGDDVSGG